MGRPMPVTVRLPTALRTFAANEAKVPVEAPTVGAALAAVVEMHPDLRKHLYEPEGGLRSFVNVYVGERDVRELGGLGTSVKDGDTILIVPSVAGG